MTEPRKNKILETLEGGIWKLIKEVSRLNQLYQRRPFGRMTSMAVMAQKEFIKI
jgi:hypothetical protein